MPILTSVVIVDTYSQANGSHYVIERHTDTEGVVYQMGPYLVPLGFNVEARMAQRVLEINEQMAEEEAIALADDGI